MQKRGRDYTGITARSSQGGPKNRSSPFVAVRRRSSPFFSLVTPLSQLWVPLFIAFLDSTHFKDYFGKKKI